MEVSLLNGFCLRAFNVSFFLLSTIQQKEKGKEEDTEEDIISGISGCYFLLSFVWPL